MRKSRTVWGGTLPGGDAGKLEQTGVFAAKLMKGHLDDFLVYARRASGDYASDDRTVIEALLPNPRFVWVRRHNGVAHAVSWFRALQTGEWRVGLPQERPPPYDFDQIDWLAHQIRVWDGAWQRWFEAQRIDPLVVWYEDLAADQVAVTFRVLEYLKLQPTPGTIPSTELRKQADAVSEEWIARYLATSNRGVRSS
jgi:trehalose 2-sulfotransferase